MQPLVAGPRANLTEQQVLDSLTWQHSTQLRWGVDLLNSQLEPTGLQIDVFDASVAWQWRAQPVEGEAPVQAQVRRQGSLTYRHRDDFNPLAVLYRPWVEMRAPVTNRAPNPSFEVDLSGWAVSGAGNTATWVTTDAWDGDASARLDAAGAADVVWEPTDVMGVPTTPGSVWSAGVYAKADAGVARNIRVDLRWWDSGGSALSSSTGTGVATNLSTWVHATKLFQVAPANTAFVTARVVYLSPAADDAVLVDAIQLESSSVLPDYGAAQWVRWHLGVFTATVPPYQYDGQSDHEGPLVTRPLELADRSHFWQSDETPDSVIVPAGTDVVQWVRDDLATRFNEMNLDGIVIDSPPKTASRDYVFDFGTPWLVVYDTLLSAVGNEPLHTDAEGWAVSPLLTDPSQRLPEHDYAYGTTVLAPVEIRPPNPELPNVVRFVASGWDVELNGEIAEGNGIRTISNETVGPGSLLARGGRTLLKRVDVAAQTQEELDAQAQALAAFYFAGGGLAYSGSVGLNPRHDDSDVVFLERPPLGIDGNWLVTGWQIQLGTADQMRVMSVEMEQLVGSAFRNLTIPPLGAYGTEAYGMDAFGGPV